MPIEVSQEKLRNLREIVDRSVASIDACNIFLRDEPMCGGIEAISIESTNENVFAEKLLGILNNAGIALMISIGHRTGLFDTLASMEAADSAEIADAAELNERYVREWLGAMVTGGIVDYDNANGTYELPQDHAAMLTRSAVPNNMASVAQFIAVLGNVEDDIVDCFKNGGGVPYEKFPRFHQVMAEESNQTVVVPLIDSILPSVDGLVDRLEEGINVLDVGCGSGWALIKMAEAYPNSHFHGYDFSEEAITSAREKATAAGLKNIHFERKDVANLSESKCFDFVTAFDAIHDQAQPATVLERIKQCLTEDGIFLMQDIGGSSCVHHDREYPLAPLLYTISCMHCMTVSLADGGAGLGAMWGKETATRMLGEAGFEDVEVKSLPHDIMNLYFVAR
ncbi:MAG: class I SAM-dependent methyltransferase [Planctomycetota bacterium]